MCNWWWWWYRGRRSTDLFKDADKSDLRLSADLHRTDYPEGVRQSSADSELRRGKRSRRTKNRGVGDDGFSHKSIKLTSEAGGLSSQSMEGGQNKQHILFVGWGDTQPIQNSSKRAWGRGVQLFVYWIVILPIGRGVWVQSGYPHLLSPFSSGGASFLRCPTQPPWFMFMEGGGERGVTQPLL